MFVDRVKIYVKAGNGGNGKRSFYSNKFELGGPDGGDGGKGGNIIFSVNPNMTTLIDFRLKVHFKAEDGENGRNKNQYGKSGENLEIQVPPGTVIRDDETGKVIADMFYASDKKIVLTGGLGGRGNAKFKTSKRQTPDFAQNGQITKEHAIWLELKTIADVGLVGFPNVGKSTLLSKLTQARPKIANYHFTTLSPNLGVAKVFDKSFVIADIPGLIEGASEGAGLGHYFLRHVERTRLILHLIDISGSEERDPFSDYQIINNELKKYSEKILETPQILVFNKCDLPQSEENFKKFVAKFARKKQKPIWIKISALTGEGLNELLKVVYDELKKLPPIVPEEYEPFEFAKIDPDQFEISRASDGSFVVTGGLVDELSRKVVIDDPDSFSYFQKTIKEKGVLKALRKAGAINGSIVRMGDMDFDFTD